MIKSKVKPLRISQFIAAAKKMPKEEAAAIGMDEFRGTLIALGVSPSKVAALEDKSLEHVNMIRGMSDQAAFNFFVDYVNRICSELGVGESYIRALQFE